MSNVDTVERSATATLAAASATAANNVGHPVWTEIGPGQITRIWSIVEQRHCPSWTALPERGIVEKWLNQD